MERESKMRAKTKAKGRKLLGTYCLKNIDKPYSIPSYDVNNSLMKRESAEEVLKTMRQAFVKIHQMQVNELSFEELYRIGYSLTMNKYGNQLYNELSDSMLHHLQSIVERRILPNMNDNFLGILTRCWEEHNESLAVISDVLMYADRVFVVQNCLNNVHTLGLEMFKNTVVYHETIQTYLKECLINLITLDRNGIISNHCRGHLKFVTKMLMELGNGNRDVYEQIFESPFLDESTAYFVLKSVQFLSEGNAAHYLLQVELLIQDEQIRSEQCFDEETTGKLIKVSENVLLGLHLKDVAEMENSGLIHMIEHHRCNELSRMYALFKRVPEGLEIMLACISYYLRQKGHEFLNKEEDKGLAMGYLESLLVLKEQFDYYLVHSFSNDKDFKRRMASDFEYIVNIDPKLPEYLSLFFDERFRKAGKSVGQEDHISALEKTVAIFRFVQNKDLFEQYYKQQLAKRLLSGKTVNEELEKLVVTRLKEECGCHFTRKLEGMFHDISTSNNLVNSFRNHLTESGESTEGVDLNVKVVTTVYWPTHVIPPPCNLPSAPSLAFNTFRTFYSSKYAGRQLTLLPQLGSAELETCFNSIQPWTSGQTQPGGELRSYILQVSTYQMCVLLLFNQRPRWSLHQIHLETNIPVKDLQRALQALFMGKASQKILIKHPDTRTVDLTDYFYLNMAFTAKTNKVKIPSVQAKMDVELERQDTEKRVNDDRHFEVEAAIMRVMKAKRRLEHDNLVNEVVALLSQRFFPPRESVKTRIEILIEREYLTRNSNDKRIYEYIPS